MDLSSLLAYLGECKKQGFSDQQIREVLKQNGWPDALIDQGFVEYQPPVEQVKPVQPSSTPGQLTDQELAQMLSATDEAQTKESEALAENHHKTDLSLTSKPKTRKWFKVLLIVIAVLIALIGTTVAFAELGYLPAVSKIYRQANITNLWSKTGGEPMLVLANAYANSIQNQGVKTSMGLKLTIESVNGVSASTKVNALPVINQLSGLNEASRKLANFANSTPALTLGLVGTDCLDTTDCLPASNDPLQQISVLPLTFDLQIDASKDTKGDSTGTIKMGLAGVKKAIPYLDQALKEDANELIFESRLISTEKTLYWRTNFLPTIEQSQTNQWFVERPITTTSIQKAEEENLVEEIKNKLDSNQQEELKKLVKEAVTNQGIQRINDQIVMVYHLNLSQANYQSLINLIQGKSVKLLGSTNYTDNIAITGDIYMDNQTAQIIQANVVIVSQEASYGYKLTMTVNLKQTYQEPLIKAPENEEKMNLGLAQYWTSLQAKRNELYNEGIITNETYQNTVLPLLSH